MSKSACKRRTLKSTEARGQLLILMLGNTSLILGFIRSSRGPAARKSYLAKIKRGLLVTVFVESKKSLRLA